MATEFQMQPAGIIETGSSQLDISTLMIPRLTPKQVKSVNNSRAIPLIHHTGPKKVLPPAISKNIEINYDEVCARQISLEAAQKKDVEWLNSLMKGQDAMEWNGFNNQESECSETCKHIHVGLLIDAPPSHPDTILTTLTYMQKSLLDMGMIHIHLSMDMQLFEVTNKYADTIL